VKHRGGCVKAGVALAIVLGALGVIAAGAYVLAGYRQRQIRAQYAPPAVLVTDPAAGAEVPAGSHLVVSSTAVGMRPIVRVELWMDGELQEAQESDRPEGLFPFYADFDLLITSEGPHQLFVRAVDTADVVGQSAMVSVAGVLKPAEIFQAIAVQEGDTLDGIAAANGIGPGVLDQLNPGLGSPLAPGSVVKVPAPSDAQPEAQPPETPPVPAGGTQIQIPDVAMMQIASDRSTGLTSIGTFIPEPFVGNISPPATPTGLQAEVKGCKIAVRWNDNADDEENYYIYMVPVTFHGFALPAANLKPSPGTGPAWFELQPTTSGTFGISVDVANSYGSRSSATVWVYVEYQPGCPVTAATSLDIKVLDLSAAADLEKAYCYLSLENSTEQRTPSVGDFVTLQGGKSQASYYLGLYSIPLPKDSQLDVSGECWGWSADQLRLLGTFAASFAPETWLGDRQAIKREALEIGISIQPSLTWGSEAQGSVSIDPTLPVPYALREDPPPAEYQGEIPAKVTLRWKWDGDPTKIDSFEIYLNGLPYQYGVPHFKEQERMVSLRAECGQMVRWQVAVRTGSARSSLSSPLDHVLPPCQAYLRVRFDEIRFEKTDDGWPGDTCDTLDAYFQLSVRDVTRSFWNTNFVIPLKCYLYQFADITGGPHKAIYGAEPYVITIPLSPGEDPSALWIKARFWDSDSWNPDDLVATFAEHPMNAYVPRSGERWNSGSATAYCTRRYNTGYSVTEEAKSTLSFTYTVYPNECRDIPPAEGF